MASSVLRASLCSPFWRSVSDHEPGGTQASCGSGRTRRWTPSTEKSVWTTISGFARREPRGACVSRGRERLHRSGHDPHSSAPGNAVQELLGRMKKTDMTVPHRQAATGITPERRRESPTRFTVGKRHPRGGRRGHPRSERAGARQEVPCARRLRREPRRLAAAVLEDLTAFREYLMPLKTSGQAA